MSNNFIYEIALNKDKKILAVQNLFHDDIFNDDYFLQYKASGEILKYEMFPDKNDKTLIFQKKLTDGKIKKYYRNYEEPIIAYIDKKIVEVYFYNKINVFASFDLDVQEFNFYFRITHNKILNSFNEIVKLFEIDNLEIPKNFKRYDT